MGGADGLTMWRGVEPAWSRTFGFACREHKRQKRARKKTFTTQDHVCVCVEVEVV